MRNLTPAACICASVMLLAGCTYQDGAFRPDNKVRAERLGAVYKSFVVGKTTRDEAEAALGQPYCRRSLRDGDLELRWGGPMTRVRAVHFLGVETKRYVAYNSWAFALIFEHDVVVGKTDVVVNGNDGSEPCVETCPECFASAGRSPEQAISLEAGLTERKARLTIAGLAATIPHGG